MTTARKTRNIALTGELDSFVEALVSSGKYQSASEVVRSGLRLLQDDRERLQSELDEIRGRVQMGLADLEAGRYTEGAPEELFGAAKERALNRQLA